MDNVAKVLAELFGTTMLLFAGCTGGLAWKGEPAPFFLAPFTFGFVVMMMVQICGPISGAHFNPAVTVSALFFKLLSVPVSSPSIGHQKKKKRFLSYFSSTARNRVCHRSNTRSISRLQHASNDHTSSHHNGQWWRLRFLYNSTESRFDTIARCLCGIRGHFHLDCTLLFLLGSQKRQEHRLHSNQVRFLHCRFVFGFRKSTYSLWNDLTGK